MIKLQVLLVATAVAAIAQTTQLDLHTQSKSVDFSNANLTKPVRVGNVLPAVCGIGEAFFNTSAPAGSNLYICPATNVWQALGAGGSSGSGGAATSITNATVGTLPSTCNTGDVRFATDATVSGGGFYTYFCTGANTWTQFGYVAGGSGALAANCSSLPCSIDTTAAVPLKSSANTWTGANNFSGSAFVSIPTGTPASSSAACTAGSIQYDASYFYICTATNTWKRVALSSF
jgi:hypothetical protein